jgi:2-polyprenyl-6-methoxyphenol hydroxylase-like FAD-dependent oxidoreductase
MYDAIIIGARVAGAPTAMLLARKGYRVLLLDRAAFPSDTMSTHLIHQPGVAILKRWGLLDRVVATGCPPITSYTLDADEVTISGSPAPLHGIRAAYCPRRHKLDDILVGEAVVAGAELRERFAVQEILMGGGRVTGVRGRAADGRTVTERARIVIGADGKHSLVARAMGAASYNEVPSLSCYYYSYWSGVPVHGMEAYPREGRAFGAFPTNDGLTCVFVAWPHAEFHRFRADVERNFMGTLELAPGLAERVRAGRREERWIGTADLPNRFRTSFGPGWALVGDAGYHQDPITGFGITNAFRDAEQLAGAINAGLCGLLSLDEALAEYQRRRDEAALPWYQAACEAAALGGISPQLKQFLAALRYDSEQTSRFFGILAGTVRPEEFFTPENIQRILAGVAPAEAAA